MPVYKFKSFEEAEQALWADILDSNYYKKVAELWRFANKLKPYKCQSGVFKFKTIQQANKHQEKEELNN